MKYTSGLAFAVTAALVGLGASKASAALVVDNFEEYSIGAIATAYNSTPWERFGQIGDNLYATTAAAQDGVLGADIGIAVSGFGGASVLKNLGGTTDLSAYSSATVLSKSLTVASGGGVSTAAISLSLTDGNTTYQSTVPGLESGVSNMYTFLIDDVNLTDVDDEAAPETLAYVLSHATAIGFRITSPTGVASNEDIAFDDFILNTTPVAIPEPATAGLAFIGVAAASGLRRRRRTA